MLQNVVGGLQGIVDHAMVGHYVGLTANAAIGVSLQVFILVIVFIASVFSGMGVLVARFTGAGDAENVNRTVYQAFLTAIFMGVGILAPVGYLLAPWLLDLVNAAPEVQREALPYLRIMFVFSIGMLTFFMMSGALRAAGDARTPLRLGVLMTIANIVLNVILIGGLGPVPALGTAGAAMGTAIASGLTGVAFLWLLFSGRLVIRFDRHMSFRPDWPVIRELFRFGLPTGVQGIAMNVAGVMLLRFIGSLEHSAEAQAAYAVGYTELFSLITWTSVGPDERDRRGGGPEPAWSRTAAQVGLRGRGDWRRRGGRRRHRVPGHPATAPGHLRADRGGRLRAGPPAAGGPASPACSSPWR
ncbi:MAG: MATE family efflux transporter [Vicinamibacterales bacterium]